MTRSSACIVAVVTLASCAANPAVPPMQAPVAGESGHAHELHLPPVGPNVRVTLEGQAVDVPLAGVPHEGTSLPLIALWKAAWPSADVATLNFDLTGSDGFHPAARPPCVRRLTGAEVSAARVDVVSHDVSFDRTVQLPGCYRVKAVVALDATR